MVYNTMRNSSGFQGNIESGFSAELNGDIPGNVVLGVQGPKGDPGPQGIPGVPGKPFTYEDFTPEQLAALKGEPGYTPQKGIDYFDGQPGTPGDDYVLTPADKAEIAEMAAKLVEVPAPDSGGNVAYDEVQNLTDEQKAQARENIGAQPAGNYLTEVPEGYAKKDDIPTDEEIIQLIEEHAPEGSGGGIAVTGAKVGQTVKIAEVDENGVPTAWEPTDFPSGGGGKPELIATFELVPDVLLYEQDVTGYREVALIPVEEGTFSGAQIRVSGVSIGKAGNGDIKHVGFLHTLRAVSHSMVVMEHIRSTDTLLNRSQAVAEWGTIGITFTSVTGGKIELWGVK